jgi:hypothetical protein
MSIVFLDSFQHYTGLNQKWSSGEADFNTNSEWIRNYIAGVRTQSLNPNGGSFSNIPRINFSNRTNMIFGVSYIQEFAVGNQIMYTNNQPAGGGQYGEIDVSIDGALVLKKLGGAVVLATSAPGIIGTDGFYYIEQESVFTQTGSCIVRVNGEIVITFSGDMTDGTHTGVDGFLLPGSAVNNCYYNDLYVLDASVAPNNSFLGAVLIFAFPSVANESPLNFTPLANTNWQEVATFPPPGDAAYVFDDNVGAIDQYEYSITGIPGTYLLKGIQHCMSARLDAAGSHTLFSQLNATTGQAALVGSNALTEDYAFVLCPYDTNPNTGVAFQPSDFSTTFLGPNITS